MKYAERVRRVLDVSGIQATIENVPDQKAVVLDKVVRSRVEDGHFVVAVADEYEWHEGVPLYMFKNVTRVPVSEVDKSVAQTILQLVARRLRVALTKEGQDG